MGTNGASLSTNGSKILSWATPVVGSTRSIYLAGEALTAGNAVFASAGTEIKTSFDASLVNATTQRVGDTTIQKYALSVSVGGTAISVAHININLFKTGTPADNLVFAIQADSAGSPSGTDIITATIAGTTFTTGSSPYTITFAPAQTLSTSTAYWVVLSRSGAQDASNYYNYGAVNSGGNGYYYNGTAWAYTGWGSEFTLDYSYTTGSIYKTNAAVTGMCNGFLGFVNTSAAAGANVTVDTTGINTSQSGLTTGGQYYLANSYGAVLSSAGTCSRKVGIAATTTQILITNIW